MVLYFLKFYAKNKRITERMTSTIAQREHKDLFWETLTGNKTQQNFLDVDFNKVHYKTQRIRLDNFLLIRLTVYPLYNELA